MRSLGARRRIQLLVVAVVLVGSGGSGLRAEPIELDGRAFGEAVEIEIQGLAPADAEAAARAAFARVGEVERTLAAAVARANEGSAEERVIELDPLAIDLLVRAQQFCLWSQGALGPLGGNVYDHWDRAAKAPRAPPLPPFAPQSAACERMRVDPAEARVIIAAGSRVDLRGFQTGFAVDRAVDRLRERGVTNARVAIGRVTRYVGPGPEPTSPGGRRGWKVNLPIFEGYERPLDRLALSDRSVAIIWRAESLSGQAPFVDLRTGRHEENSWATIAVTELAVDAQALAVAAFVLGNREGRFRVATLEPSPSVLWILGTGQGRGLLTDHMWGALSTP